MIKHNIFSPFFYQTYVEETPLIQEAYLDKMIENYNYNPNHSHDWNVHTDYMWKDTLPHKLDWWDSIQHYKKYVNQFIYDYFRGLQLNWKINETPWYNVYGQGHKADQHSHLPCDFSAVHFLKFNPEVHEPIRFLNPRDITVKYLAEYKPHLHNNLGTCTKQSYFKEFYVPEIVEGSFIIFPSDMEHLVWPSQTDELRIVIAFNFNIHE